MPLAGGGRGDKRGRGPIALASGRRTRASRARRGPGVCRLKRKVAPRIWQVSRRQVLLEPHRSIRTRTPAFSCAPLPQNEPDLCPFRPVPFYYKYDRGSRFGVPHKTTYDHLRTIHDTHNLAIIMLSTSFPTPAHKALPEASAQVPHPCSFASEVDAVNPQRICFYHSGEVSVRGAHVLAFCNTITSPGLQPIARQVRRVTFDFEHVRPTRACLEAVADALAAMPNVEELTLLGMPNRDIDGWILRGATFRLWLFATTMSLTSKDVLDFLRAQPDITSLGTFSPPLPDMPQAAKNAYQHMPFPADVARRLTTLDCSAPFLLSLQAASPPTRPLVNMRVDLNRLNPNVESESLKALAAYSSSVKRLSLRRTTLRQLPATGDRSGALSMAAVLNRAAPNKRWARTEFLEMYDGTYDAVSHMSS